MFISQIQKINNLGSYDLTTELILRKARVKVKRRADSSPSPFSTM